MGTRLQTALSRRIKRAFGSYENARKELGLEPGKAGKIPLMALLKKEKENHMDSLRRKAQKVKEQRERDYNN